MSNKRKAGPVTRSQKRARTQSTLWNLQPKPKPTFDAFWTMLRGNEGMQQSFYSGLRDPISFTLKTGQWVVRKDRVNPNLYELHQINLSNTDATEMTYTFENLETPRSEYFKVPVLKWDNFVPSGGKDFGILLDRGDIILLGRVRNRVTFARKIQADVEIVRIACLAPGKEVNRIDFKLLYA